MSTLTTHVRVLVEALEDAAIVVSPDLDVLCYNDAYAAIARLPSREPGVRGACHTRLDITACDDECLAWRAIRMGARMRAVATSRVLKREFVVTATPIFGDDQEPLAVLETYRDATDGARANVAYDEMLERARDDNDRLREEVFKQRHELIENTDELTAARAKLVQSEKMSALGQLVAGVAHEINNPANFIYGNLFFLEEYTATLVRLVDNLSARASKSEGDRAAVEDLLARESFRAVRADAQKSLAAMRTGTERITRLVQDLTVFAHPGSRYVVPCDLGVAIRDALATLPADDVRGVVIDNASGQLPLVPCIPQQIAQVVTNLVVNAIHATQAVTGPRRVRIATHSESGHAVIDIEDNGSGIPRALRGKIFDPFFTTKPMGKGTGLGLFIAFSIVQAHGGEMEILSEESEGTTMRVRLPLEARVRRSTAPPPPLPSERAREGSERD